MTRALVVYESMFGHARKIAEAVAVGLQREGVDVSCVEVGKAPKRVPDDVALLVVGGPTHGTTLPNEQSRKDAARRTDQPLVSQGIGLREWLAALAPPRRHVAAATFDTRMTRPKLVTRFDHAAKLSRKSLKKRGFAVVAEPEWFFVQDVEGPLEPGEAKHARTWGSHLAALLVAGGKWD